MKRLFCFILSLFYLFTIIKAQQNTVASGGDIISPSGSVSYSVGQIDYQDITSNESINEGNQQPYEFYVITGTSEEVQLLIKVFPNPVTYNLKLLINKDELSGYSYKLFSPTGQLLTKRKIDSDESLIHMGSLANGNYLLQVLKNENELKTFKIIKNH